ncbi:oxygen-independent coproporphyrinogen III oxidase [uncultured Aquincola sp.]|uniref:oxygen-independent coproporphyrinogen III oxidase n=1 Tax=uncultured Aquincola sp. TaxID=886556 RepID=UPI0032B1D8DF
MNAILTPLRTAPLNTELLRRFDVPGPRYTSYPTADRFIEAFGPDEHADALHLRSEASVGGGQPLSLYVHVPFCESVCYYCACNKVITRRHERSGPFLNALATEVALHAQALGRGQPVSQVHLGGGSPTFMSDDELASLLDLLRSQFRIVPGAELSIEVDPRTVDAQRLAAIRAMGFNRLSLGVQDFDTKVQQAVHRVQPLESVAALMKQARALKYDSINVDLIYGLPRQTQLSVATTIAQVIELQPDRIALYAYAHLPQRFKPQRRIHAADLPAAADRVQMLEGSVAQFLDAGYVYIGMDHFARPTDPLAVAKRQGRLHRNFQGYSTQPDCDLIGLGPSAISRIGATYSQNAKDLQAWTDALEQGRFAVERGLALTRDDLLRRAVIMALMCQGRLEFESIELAHLVKVPQYFAEELRRLQPLAEAGLLELGDDAITITPAGWYVVRAIAMVFDRHLQSDRQRERFSRVI